jgi:hypothetical protein
VRFGKAVKDAKSLLQEAVAAAGLQGLSDQFA